MRILIWHHFYAQPGGEDAVVAAEMAALQARGHEVRLLSQSTDALRLGGSLAALRVAGNGSAARLLEAELDAFKPDLVHAHNLFPGWGIAPLRVLIRRRQPAVQTLHNFRWLCAKATLLRDGKDCSLCAGGNYWPGVLHACVRDSRILSAAYGLALRRNRRLKLAEAAFDRFICVSEFVRRRTESAKFGAGRLALKGHFAEAAPGPLGDGDGSVVFAGRLAEEKGFDVLGQAMLTLPQARLKVAGDGPGRMAWEGRLGSRVEWLGRLEKPALMDALRRSSVCVVPSLGTETFGLAALDAFACGLPVVCSDAGGLPELVQDGVNGFVVPRGDESALAGRVKELLGDLPRARAMGQAGLEMVKSRYLSQGNLEILEAIYGQAIEERKTR